MHLDAGPCPSSPRASDGETARFGKVLITDHDLGRECDSLCVYVVLDQIPPGPLARVTWLEPKGREP